MCVMVWCDVFFLWKLPLSRLEPLLGLQQTHTGILYSDGRQSAGREFQSFA